MATIYIAEYAGTGYNPGMVPVVATPPIAEQIISIGGSSTQSTAFKSNSKLVRVHTDAICSIAFGTSPTATTSTMRLGAGQTEYFDISSPSVTKLAVITNT